MKFRTRLLVSAVAPALLFLAALVLSLIGMFRTEGSFEDLLAREQHLAQGFTELYGHGLQMGQALRNIVLDDSNAKAYENLKIAQQSYEKTYDDLVRSSAGTPLEAGAKALAPLRAKQASAQEEVLALAKTDHAGAMALLNAKETPAWRALRADMMKLVDEAQEHARERQAQTRATARMYQLLALALAALAVVVAGGFLWSSQRTVRRELGGDPGEAREALKRIASGDLSVDTPAGAAPASLMADLGTMQDSLRRLVGNVRQTSESILVASTEVANGSADLSGRTEQAASNLQETAAAMEEIAASVQKSADSTSVASQLAGSAVATAGAGGEVVARVVRTMQDISEGSHRIGNIIGVIDGIAFQTNILALNAAVEAARAGEQGRGFAVVASEVRTLAQRSAEAAKEIKSLITTSVESVGAGSSLVAEAGGAMNQIIDSVHRVTDIVQEISTAAGEQSTGVRQIGAAVSNLDDMTQQNAALVEESAAAAESLKEQASSLSVLVRQFRLPA